jgi:hypothetical protein
MCHGSSPFSTHISFRERFPLVNNTMLNLKTSNLGDTVELKKN